jgi:parallel beta-helix repeat protein
MRSIVRGLTVVVVGCVALRGAAAGVLPTVYVPGQFATIQEAVDSIAAGGTVEVAPGNYGPVTIGRAAANQYGAVSVSRVTLRGVGAAVIDGGAQPAITVIDGNDVVVDGFTVTSESVGVSVVRGFGVTVQNVTVQSAGSDGIRADTVTDVKLMDNRIESAGGTGINVSATTSELFGPLTVSSNTVLAAGGDGIMVHNLGDGAETVISGNVVTNVQGRGIRSECGMTLHVEHNDVSTTGQTAVSIFQVNDRVTVSQNTISDAGGAGIDLLNAPHVAVTDNSIAGTGGDGVTLVSAPDVTVDRNVVTSAGDAGIRVSQDSDADYTRIAAPGGDPTIRDNVVTSPLGTGIVLDHARPIDVAGNTITDPGVHGIELDGARGVNVTGNEVTGAASCGFRLENGARRNVLAGNTATDCTPGLWAPGVTRKKNRIAGSNRFRKHSRR